MGLSPRLAFGYPPIEVGLSLRKVVRLGQHDEVENVIKTAVAATIEAVPCLTRRRRLERRGSSVGRELSI